MRPLRGVDHAQHGLAHGLDHVLVGREARADQLDALRQPRGHELLDEVDAHAARQEDVDRIGLGRADLGQLGRVVDLAQLGVDLLAGRGLVAALEADQRILARRIVGRHDEHLLEATVGGQLAGCLVEGIVLVGRAEPERIALRARELAGAGVVGQVGHLGAEQRRAHGQCHVGADGAGEEIHLVALYVARDQLARLVGVATHVGLQELGRLAAQLAAQLLDGEVEAVTRLGAQRGKRPGNIVGDTDLDGVRLRERGNKGRGQGRCGQEGGEETHAAVLLARAARMAIGGEAVFRHAGRETL